MQLLTCAEVAAVAERNLAENTGFLARVAWSDDAIRITSTRPRAGAAFLLIYAPGDSDTARALSVIRHGPFEFVHRYHRLPSRK